MDDEYFKPGEAARYLKISTSTLAKFRIYGGGPKFSRIGRSVRYKKSELDDYVTSRTVRSTSERLDYSTKRSDVPYVGKNDRQPLAELSGPEVVGSSPSGEGSAP